MTIPVFSRKTRFNFFWLAVIFSASQAFAREPFLSAKAMGAGGSESVPNDPYVSVLNPALSGEFTSEGWFGPSISLYQSQSLFRVIGDLSKAKGQLSATSDAMNRALGQNHWIGVGLLVQLNKKWGSLGLRDEAQAEFDINDPILPIFRGTFVRDLSFSYSGALQYKLFDRQLRVGARIGPTWRKYVGINFNVAQVAGLDSTLGLNLDGPVGLGLCVDLGAELKINDSIASTLLLNDVGGTYFQKTREGSTALPIAREIPFRPMTAALGVNGKHPFLGTWGWFWNVEAMNWLKYSPIRRSEQISASLGLNWRERFQFAAGTREGYWSGFVAFVHWFGAIVLESHAREVGNSVGEKEERIYGFQIVRYRP